MKKLIFVTLATATMGLVSCSSDENSSLDITAQEEIQLFVSMESSNKHVTRAAHNLQIAPLTDYDKLGIFAYKTGLTAVDGNYGYENRTVTGATDNGTNKKLELTPAMTFPLSGGNVDVYVYAPYKNTYTDVTSMAFTVQDNQAIDANYLASDFVYGKATADYSGDKTAAVTMHHALTKLTFKIDDVGNGTNAAGISAINLLNVYKTVTVDMSAAFNNAAPWLTAGLNVITNTTTETPGDIVVSNLTTDSDLYDHVRPRKAGDDDEVGNGVSVIIPAQNVLTTEGSPKVSVTIDGITKDAYLGSEGDEGLSELIPGYEYVYTLNIKSQNVIVVAVSISPWVQDTQSRDLDFTPTP
jgi:hypothetical protein